MSRPQRLVRDKSNRWGRIAGVTDVNASTIFGNPYFAPGTDPKTRAALYRDYLRSSDSPRAIAARVALPRLRGRDLACDCPLDRACHADVLLEIVNDPEGISI